MDDLTDFGTLRKLLKSYGVWAKKRLGQNFLIDKEVLEEIIAAADISTGEKVVEIGPGPGVLTQALLNAGANVEAVELDDTILPVLRAATRKYKNFLTIYHEHILNFTPPVETYKLISNIPYHLTSPILRKFLIDGPHRPERIVLLVQREVAEKICAPAGKDSHLSLMVKAFGDAKIRRIVRPDSFFPAPKVDSAILEISVLPEARISISPRLFQEMLFAGFSEARKKLRNILPKRFQLPVPAIMRILENHDISPDLRPQNLTIPQWEILAQEFFPQGVPLSKKENAISPSLRKHLADTKKM